MNRKTKWSHRLLALALAAVMCCSVFPVGAFAETPLPQESTVATEEQQTDETETDNGQTDASNPDPGATTEESAAPTTDEPAEENEPYTFDGEILYADMPDAPTGSYLGSYGLPVATGETKIGLGAWDADLEQDSYLSAEALDSDNLTLTTPLLEDTDYAIVPILAQVEYPADGSTLDLILPDGVTLLDYYGAPAENAESLLHNEYSETSAAVLGVYVQADADFTAQLVYTAPDGSTVVDFGQNMVGWVLVEAEGEAGDYVELSHGEILDQAGNLYTGNLREARQRVKYILKGEGKEVFTPHFTWQGFRYVRIDHFPGEPELERFTGLVIYSDLSQAGYFSCSNELLNRLEANIRWGMKGNFVDIPTDCPQRDERLGWTGDIQVFSRTASYLMKTAPFFRKWLRDLQAAQLPDGGIPYVVPDILTFQNRDVRDEEANHSACGWGDAATVCPYMVYRYSGDIRILEENYSMMKQWVEYIHKKAEHGTIWNRGYQYGDWLALDADSGSRFGKTPNDLTATAYYSYSVLNVIKAAKELGKVEDEKRYTDLYRCIQEAFQKTFYDEHGHLKAQTQTAQVLALAFGLTGETFRENTVNDLIRLLEEWKGISTGFLGTPQICHVLKQNGRTDLAYGLLMKTDYPSWLYAVTKGATTIWEHWDSIRTDGSFWSDGMNSFNHYAYGCIGDWIYSTVLGIDTDEEYPGYQKSIIAPVPGGGLTWVKGGCHTPYGELKVAWTLEQGLFTLNVKIPENTTSRVILPGKEQVYEVGSGSHQFQCRI